MGGWRGAMGPGARAISTLRQGALPAESAARVRAETTCHVRAAVEKDPQPREPHRVRPEAGSRQRGRTDHEYNKCWRTENRARGEGT